MTNRCVKAIWSGNTRSRCFEPAVHNQNFCVEHLNKALLGGTNVDTINPKDAIGRSKPPLSVLSCPVLYEVAVGCLEGAVKYRRHNYRVAEIQASVYYDAAMRHLMDYWEGEDIDKASGIHHVSKAMSCLFVFRDAMMNDMVDDDRPPKAKAGWLDRIQTLVDGVFKRHPNPLPPYTQKGVTNDPGPGTS